MTKSYLYEEYVLINEKLNNSENKLSIDLYFNAKLNNDYKILLKNEFEQIKDNNYIVKSNLIKYNNENNNIYSGIFYNNYIIKNDEDKIDSKLIVDIFCEMNTTNLNESFCGFKELNSNSISIKLWNDNNIYAGIATSYYVDEKEYDFIIVGGGPSGIYSTYKIATENPNSKILLLEDNIATLNKYKLKGYDKINNWYLAQLDSDFQKSYLSNDNKTIWVGKGLGGGTLHFGLQYVNNISKNYDEWKDNYDIIDNDLNPKKYEYIEEVDGQFKPNKNWYDFKMNLEKYSLNKNINVFNNNIYSTNLENLDRLLLGDLLENLKNVEIKYNSKVDKLIFTDFKNNKVDSVKTFNNKYYKSKNIILCCGALETPCILQRSKIDCGNKLYDHGAIVGLTYGKLKSESNEEKKLYFKLNSTNLEIINKISKRYIFSITGNNISNDNNKVYDFTEWANNHPGGKSSITKWRNNDNVLIYPHNSNRWITYKSRFTYIGKRDELIKYDDLPENIKSNELFNQLLFEKSNKTSKLLQNLGFNNEKIVSHLQVRDKDFKWQSYYSTVPGLDNALILTHSQSIDIEGLGYVKIKSLKNEEPNIILNHTGNNKEKVINQIYEAYIKNHAFLTNNGYILLNPNPQEILIDKKYIEKNLDSIYHYHGSCAMYEIVDENQKVYNVKNLYIGDISVLNKPWGGSTSYAALNTALNVSKNFMNNK